MSPQALPAGLHTGYFFFTRLRHFQATAERSSDGLLAGYVLLATSTAQPSNTRVWSAAGTGSGVEDRLDAGSSVGCRPP